MLRSPTSCTLTLFPKISKYRRKTTAAAATTMPRSEVHGDDIAVESYDVLVPPGLLKQEYPLTDKAKATIQTARNASMDVIDGVDDRVLVIVGPCSIHDAAQGLEVRARR